jgi:hypothetical protein
MLKGSNVAGIHLAAPPEKLYGAVEYGVATAGLVLNPDRLLFLRLVQLGTLQTKKRSELELRQILK